MTTTPTNHPTREETEELLLLLLWLFLRGRAGLDRQWWQRAIDLVERFVREGKV